MIAEPVYISNEDYHARSEIGRSDIACYIDSPREYYARNVAQTIPDRAPTPAMEFGNMVDDLLTAGLWPEQRELPSNVVRVPDEVLTKSGARSGKAYKSWFESRVRDGQEAWTSPMVLKWRKARREEQEVCQRIMEEIHENAAAKELVLDHADSMLRQPSYFFDSEHTPLPLKCRPDLVIAGGQTIVEIKTTRSLDIRFFAYEIRRRHYDIQAVMQMMGSGATQHCVVAILNKPPYDCQVFRIDDDSLVAAEARMYMALDGIANRQWYPGGHGCAIELAIPNLTNPLYEVRDENGDN